MRVINILKAFCLVSLFCAGSSQAIAQAVTDTDSVIVLRINQLANAVPLTGRLLDANTGKPVAGINVRYKDFSAAITDSVGNFSLKVPDYFVTINIEGEGYQLKQIALKGQKSITPVLYESTYTSFYDRANTPNGYAPKTTIPHAVTSLETNGAWQNSFETPDSYLQGRVAGLNAIRRSGTPNIGANLFLRGYNSLYTTSQPLVVVDGVIFDNGDYGSSIFSSHYSNPLSYIDMRDVDNITVIKDGTSTYGVKGGNGVIMITTARAKELATRIDFAAYGGVNFAPSHLPVLNASDYRTHLSNVLQSGGFTNQQIQGLPFMNDTISGNPNYYRYHYNTNWQKQVLNRSYAKNVYLKVTGGDNIAKYALSVGHMTNDGVISNTGMNRSSMRFNADLNLSKRMTAFANVSFVRNAQNMVNQGNNQKLNPLYIALIKSPFLPINEVSDVGVEAPVYADRDIFNISNPNVLVDNIGQSNSYRFFGSIGFNYTIGKNFTLTELAGLTIDKIKESNFIPRRGVVDDTLSNAIGDSRSLSQVKRLFSISNDVRLAYNKTFSNIHHLATRVGMRYVVAKTESDLGVGYNTPTDDFKTLNTVLPTLRQVGGGLGEWRWVNTYLGADYSLRDKYFVAFNTALDGSSRFGKDGDVGAIDINGYKFVLSPSVAAAWLISSENFMANSKFIELLKLRASYGISGNDDVGNYTSRQYYIAQNFLGVQGLVRGNIGNSRIQSESIRKLNGGLDLSLFKERVNITIDAFRNKTSRMLINEPLNVATGVMFTATNSGAMFTNGIEASLNARIINAKIKWDFGVNFSKYKSEVSMLPVDGIVTNYGGATMVTSVGQDPNLFYGYKTSGIYVSDAEATSAGLNKRQKDGSYAAFKGGDVRFVDVNKDSYIDENDRQVIGNPNPDLFGAFINHLEWKNLSLDLLLNFSKGNDVFNYVRSQLEGGSGFFNQTEAVKNRWAKNGDVTTMPRAAFGDPMGNNSFSDRWIEDGSYLRLKTASLTYKIPLKPGFVRYATVYITGNNLFTLTKYLGFDPEFSSSTSVLGQGIDFGSEPQFRSTQLGIRVGL
ncbi:MAG TPA: SusC/RagA family TonB-linked outer membrane protein [Chitinophagaceae bacterium]|nr:SusC/RagA family TonB-linked outer membrane protein [Chitinophagaceae bacterium]